MGCDICEHADWKRTKNGRLHPDKSGRCRFKWNPPPLPKAFYFYGTGECEPNGGGIERGDNRTDDCPCFSPLSGPDRNTLTPSVPAIPEMVTKGKGWTRS